MQCYVQQDTELYKQIRNFLIHKCGAAKVSSIEINENWINYRCKGGVIYKIPIPYEDWRYCKVTKEYKLVKPVQGKNEPTTREKIAKKKQRQQKQQNLNRMRNRNNSKKGKKTAQSKK